MKSSRSQKPLIGAAVVLVLVVIVVSAVLSARRAKQKVEEPASRAEMQMPVPTPTPVPTVTPDSAPEVVSAPPAATPSAPKGIQLPETLPIMTGHVLKGVIYQRRTDTTITVMHDGGIAVIPIKDLPSSLRAQFEERSEKPSPSPAP